MCYARWFPRMWRSDVNDAVVDLIGPRSDECVVDIGAGIGAAVVRAAATGARVIAVEPTPFMRRVLMLRCARRRQIDIVDGAAERLPVGDASVDAIWAVNTMHHWVDVDRAVAELARVLRPNGRILLVDEIFTDPSHPDRQHLGNAHDPEHHGFAAVDAERMAGLFRLAGLTDVDATNRRIADRPVIAIAVNGARAAES